MKKVDKHRASPIRLLFIGNSYIYYNDMPSILTELSRASKDSCLIKTQAVTFGGATLQAHWESEEAHKALKNGVWDYVVLQEQSMFPIQDPAKMHQYVRMFNERIESYGAKTILYLTWARGDAPETQDAISHAYSMIADEISAIIAPVGVAWQAASAQTELTLYDDDQSHPTFAGSYLAACVFYSVIMGKEPTRLVAELQGRISNEHMIYLHNVVKVVIRQFEVREVTMEVDLSAEAACP